eukprot:SAG31_NODE_18465_length_635_cov_1.244403_2_plen_68_part_01
MDSPVVQRVAAKHNISAAVVMLRFVTQKQITVVTASDELAYDQEDVRMFQIALDADDMQALASLQGDK